MTWKSFQDTAFRLTEKEVNGHIPYIISQYKQAIEVIDEDLKKIYTDILSGLDPNDYYTAMLKYDRLYKLLTEVTRQYSKYSRTAGKRIVVTGNISASNIFYRKQYNNQWLVDIEFAVLPNELIEMSVLGSQVAWNKYQKSIIYDIYGSASQYYPQAGTLSEFLAANRKKEIDSIHRAITQGLIRGQSYTKTSKAVKEVIGKVVKKDGIPHTTGAMANAIRIVRTENTRIMNQLSEANTNYARSEGVSVKRVWNAALDNRTRSVHAALDNKEENTNGFFNSSMGPVKGPGQFSTVGQNVNCRCTTFESVNGSRPVLRRGRNPVTGDNEVFDYKDFNKWAKDKGLKYNKFGQLVA